MATNAYMAGRKKYARPQAMLWADNPGTIVDGFYIPLGLETGQIPSGPESSLIDQFIILSDNNRAAIQMTPQRIEKRERMVNGRMRSYHIADKIEISTSWSMLPSRSFSSNPEFNSQGKPTGLVTQIDHDDNALTPDKINQLSGSPYYQDQQYTTDGGAGGVELLDWYNTHQGSFWVYIAYDNYKNFPDDDNRFNKLGRYNEVVEVFFSNFDYSIEKRGGGNFDFWNISLALEEV